MASGAKALLALIGWRKQIADEDTGRKLQNADNQKEMTDEAQRVVDARNDPRVADLVRKSSYRD